jgi:hypothetical protein
VSRANRDHTDSFSLAHQTALCRNLVLTTSFSPCFFSEAVGKFKLQKGIAP